jgi:hypothetical protein
MTARIWITMAMVFWGYEYHPRVKKETTVTIFGSPHRDGENVEDYFNVKY